MNRRTKKLAMDFLCGIPAATLADQEGVGSARIYQIIDKAKKAIGWHPGMHPTEAGARLRGTHHTHYVESNSVEWFYHHVLQFEDHQKALINPLLEGRQWPLGYPFKHQAREGQ